VFLGSGKQDAELRDTDWFVRDEAHQKRRGLHWAAMLGTPTTLAFMGLARRAERVRLRVCGLTQAERGNARNESRFNDLGDHAMASGHR